MTYQWAVSYSYTRDDVLITAAEQSDTDNKKA